MRGNPADGERALHLLDAACRDNIGFCSNFRKAVIKLKSRTALRGRSSAAAGAGLHGAALDSCYVLALARTMGSGPAED